MNRLTLFLSSILPFASFGCGDDAGCPSPGVVVEGRCVLADAGLDAADAADAMLDASPDTPAPEDAGMAAIAFVSPPDLIRARVGVVTSVSVEIARTDFEGPVTLTLSGLPTGAASSPVEIPAGGSVAELQVMAAATAIGGPYEVGLIAAAAELAPAETSALLYVAGAPGQQDTGFGTAGTASYSPGVEVVLGGVDLDAAAGLVAAGGDDAEGISFVVRFTEDGGLDPEFGVDGAITGLGVGQTRAFDIQSVGGALRVLGAVDPFDTFTRPLVRAYSALGELAIGYGMDGDAALPVGPRFIELARRGDGLVARSRDELVALDATGAVVSSFAPDLLGQTPSSVVADESGATTFGVENDTDYVIVRVGPTGALDSTFGTAGVVRIGPPVLSNTSATVVLSDLLPDGSLYVGGVNRNSASRKMTGTVFRLTSTGTFDESFSDSLVVFSTLGEVVQVEALTDGVLVLGWDRVGTDDNPVMRRYLSDGTLDPDFAEAGSLELPRWATSTFDSVGLAGTMVVDEIIGRVYVCGTTVDGNQIACRRYWL